MRNEKDFAEINSLLEKLHKRLVNAHVFFKIWRALEDSKIINKDSSNKKEVGENVEMMNRYGSFFMYSIESHRKIHLIELAKFFDVSSDSLSIGKIIDYIQDNKKFLKVGDFNDFNKNRRFIENLVVDYKGVQKSNLKKVRIFIKNRGLDLFNGNEFDYNCSIGKLKKFRDQYLAHDDVVKEDISISIEEIEDLFKLAKDILNLLSNKLNHNLWSHSYILSEAKRDVECLIEDLKKTNDGLL